MFWDKSIWEFHKYWSRGFWEEDPTLVLKISWEDLPSYEDLWLIVCKAKTSFREFEMKSNQFFTWEEWFIFSSLVTISIYDLIGFAKEISFKGFRGFGDSSFWCGGFAFVSGFWWHHDLFKRNSMVSKTDIELVSPFLNSILK